MSLNARDNLQSSNAGKLPVMVLSKEKVASIALHLMHTNEVVLSIVSSAPTFLDTTVFWLS